MSQKVKGNLHGLAPSQIRDVEKLYRRRMDREELCPLELAREVCEVAQQIGRRIGLLVSREGRIEEVFVGKRDILYLPELGRYRFGKGRLRRLRLIFSDLSKSGSKAHIPPDIYADLEKLRLDAVVSLCPFQNRVGVAYAHLVPTTDLSHRPVVTEEISDLARLKVDFFELMEQVEDQLDSEMISRVASDKTGALLVGVYSKDIAYPEASMRELAELAYTAGVEVLGKVIQRRRPDPRTLLGKGKLEEVVLQCLRVGAELIIFDTELKPFQWRVITNSTELKVIDRSMLILDIFAQRATSSDGRIQVELAQLKYNLPRLVEKDIGLSRLTGGIGGRGPGETKLEIGRRRIRDKVNLLEKRIEKLSKQRELRRSRRKDREIPLVAILGYTNAGKSTLFNALTKSSVLAEDKLFATLDPAQRRLVLPLLPEEDKYPADHPAYGTPLVLSDTVGFIQDLPDELRSAFRATLEELYEAALLVHVVDISEERFREHMRSVDQILNDMELSDVPRVLVFNKADRLESEQRELILREYGGMAVSALERIGLKPLMALIEESIVAHTLQAKVG